MDHILVLYRPSRRADTELQRLKGALQRREARVTVLAVVRHEREHSGCCDRRSVLWNGICQELAREDLARAARAMADEIAQLDHVSIPESHAADVITREALVRNADRIVLADPSACGLGALERRRLRRRSPIPVYG